MLCYGMLYNICYVMVCDISYPMLYNMLYMLLTYDMLYNMLYMLYNINIVCYITYQHCNQTNQHRPFCTVCNVQICHLFRFLSALHTYFVLFITLDSRYF